MAIDPVCGMNVAVDNPAGGTSDFSGTTYYFCGDGCRRAFEKEPESYVTEPVSESPSTIKTDVDPTAPISFTAIDDPSGEGNYVDVEYQCVCGCRPGARVVMGSSDPASEHCCCGRVHFAGDGAEQQIRSYMADRAKTNMDEDVGPYVYAQTETSSGSGLKIPVSYAQPVRPRK
ncbi:MAG: YHS domain-containing protein [Chloroflexi bacterium]|nr:YHS domain-containing protein [Chloroflexota bacterium]